MRTLDDVAFGEDGLVPAMAQTRGGELRMLAWMNREALQKTLDEGYVTFWSRSRRELWTKGSTSGNRLRLLELHADCDGDALLMLVDPEGPTCHRGTLSCFDGEDSRGPSLPWLERLEGVLKDRRARASLEGSYTGRLFAQGVDRIGKKVVEEAGEVILAVKNLESRATPEHRVQFLDEAADLLFHLQVLLVSQGLSLSDVADVLRRRHRTTG